MRSFKKKWNKTLNDFFWFKVIILVLKQLIRIVFNDITYTLIHNLLLSSYLRNAKAIFYLNYIFNSE